MASFTYAFKGRIEKRDYGRMSYAAVFVPKKVCKDLPLSDYPRLRIRGQINETPHKGALQPRGDGRWYVMLSKKTMNACGVSLGDRVAVGFEIDDQDAVDVPGELQAALEANDEAVMIWRELTAGKKRGFAYMVDSAKRKETRERRAEEVLQQLFDIE